MLAAYSEFPVVVLRFMLVRHFYNAIAYVIACFGSRLLTE